MDIDTDTPITIFDRIQDSTDESFENKVLANLVREADLTSLGKNANLLCKKWDQITEHYNATTNKQFTKEKLRKRWSAISAKTRARYPGDLVTAVRNDSMDNDPKVDVGTPAMKIRRSAAKVEIQSLVAQQKAQKKKEGNIKLELYESLHKSEQVQLKARESCIAAEEARRKYYAAKLAWLEKKASLEEQVLNEERREAELKRKLVEYELERKSSQLPVYAEGQIEVLEPQTQQAKVEGECHQEGQLQRLQEHTSHA